MHAKTLKPEPLAGDLPLGVVTYLAIPFAMVMASALWGFGRSALAALCIAICIVYCLMYFGTPLIMVREEIKKLGTRPRKLQHFFAHGVDTCTGHLTGHEALLQIMLIPSAIALGFTAFAVINVWVR